MFQASRGSELGPQECSSNSGSSSRGWGQGGVVCSGLLNPGLWPPSLPLPAYLNLNHSHHPQSPPTVATAGQKAPEEARPSPFFQL